MQWCITLSTSMSVSHCSPLQCPSPDNINISHPRVLEVRLPHTIVTHLVLTNNKYISCIDSWDNKLHSSRAAILILKLNDIAQQTLTSIYSEDRPTDGHTES